MPKEDSLKPDAEAIEEKYGPLADVYAESRTEAAEIAGDETGKEHWKTVAANLKKDREQ